MISEICGDTPKLILFCTYICTCVRAILFLFVVPVYVYYVHTYVDACFFRSVCGGCYGTLCICLCLNACMSL